MTLVASHFCGATFMASGMDPDLDLFPVAFLRFLFFIEQFIFSQITFSQTGRTCFPVARYMWSAQGR